MLTFVTLGIEDTQRFVCLLVDQPGSLALSVVHSIQIGVLAKVLAV